ncbi:MAG: ribose-phosphate diphosphokinase [Candidatus Pacebacteria bacterium]|nr:ribose-phosphate diphosphokinase [Candidatus Paceibacterota bacterium]
MKEENFIILSGTGHYELADKTIQWINNSAGSDFKFSHINFDSYPDGEDDFRIPKPEKIKDKNVIIFQSCNTLKLKEEFLTLVFACKKQYQAKKVIAVMPFMMYRRQERQEKFLEINRNLQFVTEMKAVGVDEILLCDIHSETALTYFKEAGITVHNTSGAKIFAELLEPVLDKEENVVIYSPDKGSIVRAINLAKLLHLPVLFNLKERSAEGTVEQKELEESVLQSLREEFDYPVRPAENLDGQVVIMVEDEIATGSTAKMTAKKLKERGAKKLIFCATHPVCTSGWKRTFVEDSPFDKIILGNTVDRGYKKSTGGKVTNASMHPVLAIKLLSVIRECEKE